MCFLIWPSLVHTLEHFRREHDGFVCESSFTASNQKSILIPQYFQLPLVFPSPHPSVRLCHSFVMLLGYFASTYLPLWDPLCVFGWDLHVLAVWKFPKCLGLKAAQKVCSETGHSFLTPTPTFSPFMGLSFLYFFHTEKQKCVFSHTALLSLLHEG